MPTVQKESLISEIKGRFADAESVIMTDYRGLTVKEMQELRTKLREAGSEIKVYKNSLTEIAIRELELPNMDAYLAGPTAFVFAGEDPVAPAKALAAFAKLHQALELKGGIVQGQVVDAEGVKAIATLPSREELIARIMGGLVSPIRGFMGMANAPAGALARVFQAVADQKAAA
jgi:large subunit ribosomal protein L10